VNWSEVEALQPYIILSTHPLEVHRREKFGEMYKVGILFSFDSMYVGIYDGKLTVNLREPKHVEIIGVIRQVLPAGSSPKIIKSALMKRLEPSMEVAQ
jgi:hypothetical protein